MHRPNPFSMPSDEEVFVLRDEERRQKAKARDGRHPTEKSATARTETSPSRDARGLKALLSGHPTASDDGAMKAFRVTLPQIDRHDKDNMATYIAKKREMGLARMSLATKRLEIRKLDDEAMQAEKRLRQQQEQLHNTHSKFDDFLRQSNMEQDAAVKRADSESKAKQEAIQEVKKLQSLIMQIDADRKKNEEQMDQCLEYKRFLDKLTPPAFFRETMKTLMIEDTRATLTQQRLAETAAATPSEEHAEDAQREERVAAEVSQALAKIQPTISAAVEEMPLEEVTAKLDAYDPARVPMYFSDPDQVLMKFVDIEEGNLFLIQTCQELEEEIETISQLFQQEQLEMIELAQQRRQQIEAVSHRIQVERQKRALLDERLANVRGGQTQDQLKQDIEEKVKVIFRSIGGLGDDSNMDTLGMLTHIEMRLEEMHSYIRNPKNGIEEAFVAQIMKQRDRERRGKARQQMLDRQAEEREKRSKAALDRSQKPVVRRVGKPVMWRSRPFDRKKKATTSDVDSGANDDDEFFQ